MELEDRDWQDQTARNLGVFLNGDGGSDAPADDSFVPIFNAWWEPVSFRLPPERYGSAWQVEIDTSQNHSPGDTVVESVAVEGRALLVLRRVDAPESA
jgi:glycogen operon protein